MLFDRREVGDPFARGNEVLVPEFAHLRDQFIHVAASGDLLSHAAHGFLDLFAHMILHVDVSSDVNQHGAVFETLASQFARRADQHE